MPKYIVSKGYVFYNKFKQAFLEGEEVEVDQDFADKQAWKLIPIVEVKKKEAIKDLVTNRAVISKEDKKVVKTTEKKVKKASPKKVKK